MTDPFVANDRIAREIVDSAFAVHTALGPGLLESVYEQCLAYELESRKLATKRQVAFPVIYRGNHIDAGFRIDMLVSDAIIVEIKATEKVLPVHVAQLLTYLKLSHRRLGFLINFNTPTIKDGIRRLVL